MVWLLFFRNPYAIGSFEIYRCSKDNKFYSPQLTSYNGVTIYVIVQPNFSTESNSDVNAYICWAKGAKNKYNTTTTFA